MRIKVKVPGVDPVEDVTLPVGDTLLVGRRPDVAALRSERPALPLGKIQPLSLPSESVSRHHVLVESTEATTVVRDLQSTNGTWIRLARGQSLALAGSAPLHLELSLETAPLKVESEPEQPRWRRHEDYAAAVCEAVSLWLGEIGVDLRVAVVSRSEPSNELIPLRTGQALAILGSGPTVNVSYNAVMPRLAAFVARQNEFFDARVQEEETGMVLASPAIQAAWRDLVLAAKAGLRVILLGSSGAGKTALASSYHRAWNPRGPFRALNCSLLGKNTEWIRTQLFGAAPGAYPGIPRGGIKGAVEFADGGTLFLDEVADLDDDAQSALLTFLDDGAYLPLGAEVERKAAVRLVCATNKDLRALANAGQFRKDLWYRLSGSVIEVPALSTRPEDVRAFLSALPEARAARLAERLAPDAWRWLLAQPWGGGFRELRSFAERLALRVDPVDVIDAEQCRVALANSALVPPSLAPAAEPPAAPPTASSTAPPSAPPTADPLRTVLDEASAAFESGESDSKLGYERLTEFVEQFLKPMFMGRACGLVGAGVIPKEVNYQDLGERLGCARGTVRTQLLRYVEMQRKPGDPRPAAPAVGPTAQGRGVSGARGGR